MGDGGWGLEEGDLNEEEWEEAKIRCISIFFFLLMLYVFACELLDEIEGEDKGRLREALKMGA